MAKRNDGGVTAYHLKANYHPEAIEYMLKKHNGIVTPEQAETADQEWAAKRLQEFTRGHGRVNNEIAEHLMQEPPLGAGTPTTRSEEFDYAKANVGLKSMTNGITDGSSAAKRVA